MKAAALFASLLLSYSAPALAADGGPITGGWSDAKVTNETTALLYKALGNHSNYAESISQPVCVLEITRLQQQSVSGINYLYETQGCPVKFSEPDSLGACKGANAQCKASQYVIRVFSQPWTDTLRVQSIN